MAPSQGKIEVFGDLMIQKGETILIFGLFSNGGSTLRRLGLNPRSNHWRNNLSFIVDVTMRFLQNAPFCPIYAAGRLGRIVPDLRKSPRL